MLIRKYRRPTPLILGASRIIPGGTLTKKEMKEPLKIILPLFFALWLLPVLVYSWNTAGLHEEPVPGSTPHMEIRNLPAESVFVDTDRDIYFAGDHLFFKAYLSVDGQYGSSLRSRVLYLSLGNESGNQLYRLELELDGTAVHGSIRLADTLQTAVYRLSAWTNNMLIAETPPFARQLAVVNRFDPEIRSFVQNNFYVPDPNAPGRGTSGTAGEIIAGPGHPSAGGRGIMELKTDRRSYGPRERVRLRIDPHGDFAGLASASLSVAREEALLMNSPGIAGIFAGEARRGGMDSGGGLKTGGEMTGGGLVASGTNYQVPVMLVLPENLGPMVSGRVVDNGSGRPLNGAVVFLSAIDSLTNLKYSRTRADGSFFFLLEDYHKGKTLHVSVFETGDQQVTPRIELREKFPRMPFSPQKMAVHPAIHAYMEELLLVRRARRAYQSEGFGLLTQQPSATRPVVPLLYGQPTHRIFTRDYLPMENLSEMSIEIVPNLRIRRQGESYSTRMIDSRSSSFFPDPPVFFMNGVWLPEIEEVAGLSSAEVTRVEVLSRPWAFGSLEFPGIVGIFTMDDLHGVPAHPTTKIIQGNPLRTGVRIDPDPHVAGFSPHIPDYREVLFWEPAILLQQGQAVDLVFTTSDLPGTYVVSLEGMTECGSPFSKTMTITVE